jgi:hypothetical protein
VRLADVRVSALATAGLFNTRKLPRKFILYDGRLTFVDVTQSLKDFAVGWV